GASTLPSRMARSAWKPEFAMPLAASRSRRRQSGCSRLPIKSSDREEVAMNRQFGIGAALVAASLIAFPAMAFEGPELYEGEQALYDAAVEEGMVVSFDTGPTWANWAAQFKAFQTRYPGV